ncbi:hypothetical protein [Brevundimonas sp. C43]|nr:hypothetical protein [Brevundimonas sp. C43]
MTDRILTTERLVMSPVTLADHDDLLALWADADSRVTSRAAR